MRRIKSHDAPNQKSHDAPMTAITLLWMSSWNSPVDRQWLWYHTIKLPVGSTLQSGICNITEPGSTCWRLFIICSWFACPLVGDSYLMMCFNYIIVGWKWKPILCWLFGPKNQSFRNKSGKTQSIWTKFGIRGQVKGWKRSGNFRRDRPILAKMGAGTIPAEPEFFFVW